jgi:hypothetical protein
MADYSAGIQKMGFKIDPSLNRSSHLLPGSGSARKREMYEAIKGTTFYDTLPFMKGAIELFNAAFEFDQAPIILTAAPKFGASEDDYHLNPYWLGAAFHKRNWVETKLLPVAHYNRSENIIKYFQSFKSRIRIPDEQFICTTSAKKHLFMNRMPAQFQILIDDRPDNIGPWIESGGIGILHTDAKTSINSLRTICREL